MMLTTWFIMTIWIILMLMINIIPVINIHKKMDREKSSPFECGFEPFSKPRLAFSIHFFYISLMFLVFDIEITLILPLPILHQQTSFVNWLLSSFIMLTILVSGLFLEWKEGSMNWA